MVHGYPMVKHLCGGLQAFMVQHGFKRVEDFRGAELPCFTTHSRLYELQSAAIKEKKRARQGLANDADWTGEGFVTESQSMVSNS